MISISEIEVALAQLFRKKGKSSLTEKEFVFAASLDLRWFTPKDAQKFLDISMDSELLTLDGDKVKPTFDYNVSMGVYVFEPKVISYIPSGENLDFPDLVKKLIGAGEKVVGYQYDGYWKDLGQPDDYETAAKDFEEMRTQILPEQRKG